MAFDSCNFKYGCLLIFTYQMQMVFFQRCLSMQHALCQISFVRTLYT
jgi:hypothetical protein